MGKVAAPPALRDEVLAVPLSIPAASAPPLSGSPPVLIAYPNRLTLSSFHAFTLTPRRASFTMALATCSPSASPQLNTWNHRLL